MVFSVWREGNTSHFVFSSVIELVENTCSIPLGYCLLDFGFLDLELDSRFLNVLRSECQGLSFKLIFKN